MLILEFKLTEMTGKLKEQLIQFYLHAYVQKKKKD